MFTDWENYASHPTKISVNAILIRASTCLITETEKQTNNLKIHLETEKTLKI